MESTYGLWLAYLRDSGGGEPDKPWAALASDDAINGFVARLQATCKPATVHEYVKRLLAVYQVVAPAHDWSRLAALVRHLTPPPPDPTRRMEDVRHPAELLACAEHLMQQADSQVAANPRMVHRAAVQYRDGLILAVLVFAAIRRGSLLALALGDTLLETADGYMIMLRSEHTKAARPEKIPVHRWLAGWITRYLSFYRPALLGDRETPELWISGRGTPISPAGVWLAIGTRTEAELGVWINPHFVRHCIATSTAIERPQDIGNLPTVLQHRGFRVTEQHYILADKLAALDSYHDVLDAERTALADAR